MNFYVATWELIYNACLRHEPRILYAFVNQDVKYKKKYHFTMYPNDDVWLVASGVSKFLKLEFVKIYKYTFSQNILFKIQSHILVYKYILKHIYFMMCSAIQKYAHGKSPRILYTTKSYNLYQFVSNLKFPKNYIFQKLSSENFLINDSVKVYLFFFFPLSFFRYFKIERMLMRIFHEKRKIIDAHFFLYLSAKIKNKITPNIFGFYIWNKALASFFKKNSLYAVFSVGNRGDEVAIAVLAKLFHIKSYMVSHGADVPIKNRFEEIEWGSHGFLLNRAGYQYNAIQTPLTEKYFDYFSIPSQRLKSGPVIWGLPIKKDIYPKSLFTILHAGTSKWYYQYFYIYESQDEYIQSLRALSNAAKHIPNCKLIIKVRSQMGLSERTILKLVPQGKNVEIDFQSNFYDLLAKANLLVSYSSTCIDDALQNNIPVLLFGAEGRYQFVESPVVEEWDELKPSAIYSIQNMKNLDQKIEKVVNIVQRGIEGTYFKPYQFSIPDQRAVFKNSLL